MKIFINIERGIFENCQLKILLNSILLTEKISVTIHTSRLYQISGEKEILKLYFKKTWQKKILQIMSPARA